MLAYLLGPTKEERQLQDEINQLKATLSDISMRDEYSIYVKTERKIVASQAKLNNMKGGRQTKDLIVRYGVPYGCQACLTLVLIGLSIVYRYTPVIQFDDRFDVVPFGGLMKFPTGLEGAVSVPFWIFVNNFVSRHVASYL